MNLTKIQNLHEDSSCYLLTGKYVYPVCSQAQFMRTLVSFLRKPAVASVGLHQLKSRKLCSTGTFKHVHNVVRHFRAILYSKRLKEVLTV